MSLVLVLLLQAGPLVTPGAAPALPHQTRSEPLRPPRRKTTAAAAALPERPAIKPCPQTEDADAARDRAGEWLAKAKGREAANAGECLGVALSRLDEWQEAAEAFRAAQAVADTPVWRARLAAMAGEAALNAGDFAAALASFDAARTDASDDAATRGGIAVFRARALVGLKREAEAEGALAEARLATPQDAQVWLLSATLSRRLEKLTEAQAQIEKADELAPTAPTVGLEAGVIAVLSGRDDAARRSWQSVIAAAPDSDAATAARGYLAQLDPGKALPRPKDVSR